MRQLPIGDDDIRATVRLLGDVAGMTTPIPDRRRAVMVGLCQMVSADIWAWVHSTGWGTRSPVGLSLIDGGWASDAERNALLYANFVEEWNTSVTTGFDRDRPTTWLYDSTHAGWGDGGVFERVIRPTGFEHLMFGMHPLGDGLFSGIALHRRRGKPAYTPRETALAHLVLGQVDWLHRVDPPAIAAEQGLKDLRPREREVLLHAINGDGRKQIAAKMRLSEHTVGDYFKSVYKRLNVSSRGELMAKFLPAGGKREA